MKKVLTIWPLASGQWKGFFSWGTGWEELVFRNRRDAELFASEEKAELIVRESRPGRKRF